MRERFEDLSNPPTDHGFPKGEWGPYDPFGINPATGEQFHAKDTFDTLGLGYKCGCMKYNV